MKEFLNLELKTMWKCACKLMGPEKWLAIDENFFITGVRLYFGATPREGIL